MKTKEEIIGRYVNFPIDGKMCRVYYESAGVGQPLLCLHTAGSDTRQYRALMSNEELLKKHQIIAFDLPYHGKSSPPAGWQKNEYKLTSDLYVQSIMAFIEAIGIKSPIVMGCSIGGRVVLHLALYYPEKFKAIIGLQSGAHVQAYYDLEWLHRPDVHGGEVCAAIVSGLVGPSATEENRWETLWHYMQSGPGVFKGDLYFYTSDGDVRERVSQIDSKKCPIYFLTGEYDYSCTPEDSKNLTNLIPDSDLTIMKGMGHFPMSEDPENFIHYLSDVLAKIK